MNRPYQFQFEWITDWETIYSDAFQQQWLSWHKAAEESHVFFHPALSMVWIDTYRPLRDIKPLFCIARNKELTIFIPLIFWKRNWKNAFQRLIVPVGYSDFDYHDPLCIGKPDRSDIERFWLELNKELKKKVVFDKFMVDGLHAQWLTSDMTITSSEQCPYISLSAIKSTEDFKQTLPSKLRHDLSRRLRRLGELGTVEFKVFTADEKTEAIAELAEFLKFHSQRWPNAYKAPEFHQHLIEKGLLSGAVHFSVIRLNEKTISWRLNFRDNKVFYSYMPTINPDFQSVSPGKIHLLFCIEDAINNGISVYDQLRGDELYKNEWTSLSSEIFNIEWSRKNVWELINQVINESRKIISELRLSQKKTSLSTNQHTNTWQFEWITDWNKIYTDKFYEEWKSLYNNAEQSHVFSHPALAMVWVNTYRHIRDIQPLFCIARSKDVTIFFPLIYWKRNWKNAFLRMVVPVGFSDYDYHDPLVVGATKYNHDRFYVELIAEIQKQTSFDKIDINGIRAKVNHNGWKQEKEFCPYCNLTEFENQEVFLGSLKSGLRGDLKRQIRRMSEKANISLHTYSHESINDALAVLPQFLNYHQQRWPKAYKAPNFHKLLLERGLAAGIVDFTELRVGNDIVSWHLGFVDKGRYYYYMPVIQPDFAALSPGKVHLLYLVNKAIENKILIFDHLRGDENYKVGWTNSIQYLHNYTQKTTTNSGIIRNWLAENTTKLLNN